VNLNTNKTSLSTSSSKKRVSLVLILLFQSLFAFSQQQSGTLSGRIIGADQQAVEAATIILEGTNYHATSDARGNFAVTAPAGSYRIIISRVGYSSLKTTTKISAGANTTLPDQVLKEGKEMKEALITGKSETKLVGEQAFTVSAIDAKTYHNSAADVNQILNRSAGVRIREDGGLGSNFNFSLNGFSGKQVKFFLDGIPMDNFGSSLTLNNIPINLAERIEVYKGVVPVSLGTDALGGAVNVVTNQNGRDFLDASYSYGSFNTHRTSVNAGYTHEPSGFRIQTNLFHNYSDNNYKIKAPITDLTNGQTLRTQTVRRFHDAYESATAQIEAGFINKKFADRLLVGFIASGNDKELQNGATIDEVYGAMTRKSHMFMPTLKYKKTSLFVDGLDLNIYASYNNSKDKIADTLARKYNWLGDFVEKPSASGEIRRSLFSFRDKTALTTANLSYAINSKSSMALNYVHNNFHRKGSDPLDAADALKNYPQQVSKNVLGLAYKYDYNDRWSTTVFAKLYNMQAASNSRVDIFTPQERIVETESKFTKPGYGIASSFWINKAIQVKASFEHTYRLPEGSEMFGDGLFVDPNVNLKPESSDNINAGLALNHRFNPDHRITFETNFIYRSAHDYIRPQVNGIKSISLNLRDVLTTGVDGDIRYFYKNFLTAGVNITYQNVINNTKYEDGANFVSYIYKDRLPNIPYLFGNADLGLIVRNVGFPDDVLSFNWNLNYVEQYFLKWPSQGSKDSKMVIPQQVSQNASVSYSLKGGRYNISLECRNITNNELFDNYRLPKPGRAFYAKLRYFISK
jgi:outer membrane receptor protein involved in Fe transport